ncbi:MAG: 2-oxoacid:acceptor oxidoreductase family protein, partial [Patescibacteria group bacterium]
MSRDAEFVKLASSKIIQFMLKNEILKILLAGDGGQGIQLLADIICRAAIDKGLYATSIPNYGLEQRGGVSLAFIQISDKEIVYPKFTKPDILLVMSEQARERVKNYKAENVIDYKKFEKANNVFFLAILASQLSEFINPSLIEKELENKLSKKHGWE